MKKICMIIVCLIMTVNIAKSQTQQMSDIVDTVPQPSKYELSGSLSAGVSSFKYTLDAGSLSMGFGGGVEVGYTYKFSERFGLLAGFGLSVYNSRTRLNDYSEQYTTIDENGDKFRFDYSLAGGYREKQSVTTFYIPLMARYIVPLGNSALKYVIAGGVKIQIPLETKIHSINPGSVTSSGYYSFEERTYTNLPQHGFVNSLPVPKIGNKIDLSVIPLLSLETGIRFPINDNKIDLRLYFDHSFTDIRKLKDGHAVEYQPAHPSQFEYNSILNTGIVDKVSLFGAGIKIGVSL